MPTTTTTTTITTMAATTADAGEVRAVSAAGRRGEHDDDEAKRRRRLAEVRRIVNGYARARESKLAAEQARLLDAERDRRRRAAHQFGAQWAQVCTARTLVAIAHHRSDSLSLMLCSRMQKTLADAAVAGSRSSRSSGSNISSGNATGGQLVLSLSPDETALVTCVRARARACVCVCVCVCVCMCVYSINRGTFCRYLRDARVGVVAYARQCAQRVRVRLLGADAGDDGDTGDDDDDDDDDNADNANDNADDTFRHAGSEIC